MRIAVINGPNLNLLGTRKPDLYGSQTLDEILKDIESHAAKHSVTIWAYQSNSEGDLVTAIQTASVDCSGIIINAAGYSHTSVAIRDALEAAKCPVVEVHLSNIYSREPFRRHSLVSEVAQGVIVGFGGRSYVLGLEALLGVVKG